MPLAATLFLEPTVMVDHEQDPGLTDLATGGEQALARLFSDCADRLTRMIQFRLDRRLWGRVDPSDVLQESYLEVSRRLADYLRDPAVPVFVWLRSMTLQVLVNVHRRHLGTKKRDASLEVSLHRGRGAMATSISLAAQLVADLTSPSQAAIREEMLHELHEAFESMDPIDREVLALRHFEDLSNNEVAEILGIQKAAASNRYVKALKRLKHILSKIPGCGDA